MSSNVPTVMVSSTFYDLRQIRDDLARFLEKDLGYRPLLSEHPSFPIDPDVGTIENCQRRVEHDADILVLVIGGRYGFVDKDSEKSVTNLEYLTARAKGIPIYAFVEKSVLSILPIWEQNPDSDYSRAASDTRLFRFIQQIRNIDKIWTHEFELASDIITILRAQFAYLMREGLQFRFRLNSQNDSIPVRLHGKALRLALEKPNAWEYRLFAQALIDEVEHYKEIRQEQRLGLSIGFGSYVSLSEAGSWAESQIEEISRIAKAISIIIEQSLPEALGPAGTSGNVEALAFTAKKLGEIYCFAIEWSQKVRRTHLPECLQAVGVEMAQFSGDIIEKIEKFGPEMLKAIDESLTDGVQRVLTLKLDFRNLDGFIAAIEQARQDCFEA